MPHLHSASINLFARVGSRHEMPEQNGLSHFLEHMFFRGCEGYDDSTALNRAMEDLGGTLDGFTMRDSTSYLATVHPDFITEASKIFGAMFRGPTFRDLDIERSIVLEEMLDVIDDRGRVIDLDILAHKEAFAGNPLAQSIDGTRKNVKSFRADDLVEHRKRYYGAKNLVLCYAGAIDANECFETAARELGALPGGRRAKEATPALPKVAPHFSYLHTEDSQSRVRLTFRAIASTHTDYPALLLLRRIVDGGLSARLQVELVEKRGIAYDVGAEVEAYSDCGIFDFEFAVAHKKLPYALEELAKVITSLRSGDITTEEVDRVRRRARISVELSLDSPFELAQWFGATQLYQAPKTPEDRLREFEAVSADDITEVARRYFVPPRLTITAVGGAEAVSVRLAKKAVGKLVEALT